MRKYNSIIAWVLIIAIIFSTNEFYIFANSFDANSLIVNHIDDEESIKYYNDELDVDKNILELDGLGQDKVSETNGVESEINIIEPEVDESEVDELEINESEIDKLEVNESETNEKEETETETSNEKDEYKKDIGNDEINNIKLDNNEEETLNIESQNVSTDRKMSDIDLE